MKTTEEIVTTIKSLITIYKSIHKGNAGTSMSEEHAAGTVVSVLKSLLESIDD